MSRFGVVTTTATIGTITVGVHGTAVTAVVQLRSTSTALTVLARTPKCSAMGLARFTVSAAMATVMMATTTVVAVGMAETVAEAKTTTSIALIARVVTPTSKDSTRAYQNVKSWPSKVTERATIATTNAVAIGTAATVASKRTRN